MGKLELASPEERIRHFVSVASLLLEACTYHSERAGQEFARIARLAAEFRRQMPYDYVSPGDANAEPPETSDGCCPLCRQPYDSE